MSEQVAGADDWRSEVEKRKSALRKACIALFRTWIPDHPEASMARGEVFAEFRGALSGYAEQLTFVSLLSTGIEDIQVLDFVPHQALSMQDLLVQREGTDAFLDAKNALRVVRRKFGMMTLVARMAGVFEQRNANALTLRLGVDETGLLNLSKLMTARIEGTAAEEERELRKRLRRLGSEHVDVYFHSEVIGRRMPVAWDVKRLYTDLHRAAKGTPPSGSALDGYAEREVARLGARQLRQLALWSPEFVEELDMGGFDPHPTFIRAADERLMLTATRSLFDEFRELRAERQHAAALGEVEASHAEIAAAAEEDFLADADAHADDEDDFLRIAQGLERIREARGLEFFRRISMVSGNLNFVDAATGQGLEGVEAQVAELDPTEGLRRARAITEAFYRARALAAVVPSLARAERLEDARAAAREALTAARACRGEEAVPAFAAAVNAALGAELPEVASSAVTEALGQAHAVKVADERAAALMRVVSTLMEAGPLPASVRSSLSAAILGSDVHFWDKKAVTSPLVEAILALTSGLDDDTIIFLRKVVSHPDVEVRCSVLRTVPIADSKPLADMLVSHLKDPEPRVRETVIERIGVSGDRRLGLYLVNHLRHDEARTFAEKRALALALARLDHARYLPMFNAMLGPLATRDDRLVGQQKPLKDDADWQRAGLEVLYHLGDREARRLLFNAATKGKGAAKPVAERLWPVVKSAPYHEPTLPRSRHDAEYREADAFDLLDLLDAAEAAARAAEPAVDEADGEGEAVEGEAAADEAPSGLFGRIKRLFGRSSAPSEVPPPRPRGERGTDGPTAVDGSDGIDGIEPDGINDTNDINDTDGIDEGTTHTEGPAPLERPLPAADGPPGALLAFSGRLAGAAPGVHPMVFALYRSADAPRALWREAREVQVDDGRFEVRLGAADDARLPALPETVWLGVEVGGTSLGRAKVSRRRRVVQG